LFASVFLFVALLWVWIKNARLEANLQLFVPFLLFIVWSGISAFWADSLLSVAHHTLLWICYLIFYCFFLYLLHTEQKRSVLLLAFAIPLTIIALSCLFDSFTLNAFNDFSDEHALKFSPGMQHFRVRYGKYAELLVVAAPIFWALSLHARNIKKQFGLLAIGVLLWLAIILSLSKGAFLAGIISFAVFFAAAFFLSRKMFDRRRIAVLTVLWLIITCGSQISFAPTSNAPSTTDFIVGNADKNHETSSMRVFTWKISQQMFADNALLGVGADNFGLSFNEARAEYASKNPLDERLAIAEDYMVERAHNEFLQILAELGIVGAAIFLSIAAGFLIYFINAFIINGYRFSPFLWSCLAGLSGFLVSSMFSSFSFRVLQNALVFFFVLALATYEAGKIYRRKKKTESAFSIDGKFVPAFSLSLVALFFVLSASANLSNYFVYKAESTESLDEAENYYRQAINFNSANASAYFSYGLRLYFKKQPDKAVPILEKALANGLDVSLVYSYLASAQSSTRNYQAATDTIDKAVKIYPYSIFLRMRYASLLEKIGEIEKSKEQVEFAHRINEKQANGWYELINTGASASALKARNNKMIAPPAHLLPSGGLYAVLDEQAVENLFPR
jgi:O-antigen ligase